MTVEYNTPILSYVPIPELHILIGVTTHLFKTFEKQYGQLAEDWLNNLNIQMTHRAQFNGNAARTLLKKVDKLQDLDPGIVMYWCMNVILSPPFL